MRARSDCHAWGSHPIYHLLTGVAGIKPASNGFASVRIVPQEDVQAHPEPLPYPMKAIKRRHYGYLVQQALDYAKTIDDGERRRFVTESIANQMKQDLFVWNRDSMDDELVAQDIARLSEGMLQLDLDDFSFDPVGESILLHGEGGKKRKKRK